MHPAVSHHSPAAPRLARVAYLGAAGLAAYGLLTLRIDPHGLLNLATWLIAALLLAVSARLSSAPPGWWAALQPYTQRYHLHPPLLILGAGLGLLVLVRFAIRLEIGSDNLVTSPALWALGWTALLLATCPASPAALWRRALAHRRELLLVLGMVLVAAGLRFWRLGALPTIINGDEGLIGTWAWDIGVASGTLTTPFSAMDGVGTLYLAVMKGLFGLIGSTPFALRLLPAVAGVLAIPATYLLARRVLGVRAATVAALLLTFSHVHIHFSRTVAVSYIYATLFVPLALYFLISGMERRSPHRLVLCALMVGLHINIYVDGWVWLVLLGLVLAAWALVDRGIFRGNGVPLAIFALALVTIIGPMVIWGLRFPDAFGSRLAVDGTFSSGWLAQEAAATGKHQAWIVAELFAAALGTFTQRPFLDFYGIGVPTLDAVTGVLWALGLVLALARTLERRMLALNGWFWGGVVALGVVTVPPSTYHYRLLVVLPVACIFAALAVETLLRWFAPATDRWRLPAPLDGALRRAALPGSALALAALVAIVAQLNLGIYFGQFAYACKYHREPTRQAGKLGNLLYETPRATSVFVLPEEHGFRYGPHLSVDFLSGRMPVANLEDSLDAGRPAALAGSFSEGLLVAAVPARRAELARVAEWFPGGRQESLLDCGREVLAVYSWRP